MTPTDPMRPPAENMPRDERLVREFLRRYRHPAGRGWQERDVAGLVARIRAEASFTGRRPAR